MMDAILKTSLNLDNVLKSNNRTVSNDMKQQKKLIKKSTISGSTALDRKSMRHCSVVLKKMTNEEFREYFRTYRIIKRPKLNLELSEDLKPKPAVENIVYGQEELDKLMAQEMRAAYQKIEKRANQNQMLPLTKNNKNMYPVVRLERLSPMLSYGVLSVNGCNEEKKNGTNAAKESHFEKQIGNSKTNLNSRKEDHDDQDFYGFEDSEIDIKKTNQLKNTLRRLSKHFSDKENKYLECRKTRRSKRSIHKSPLQSANRTEYGMIFYKNLKADNEKLQIQSPTRVKCKNKKTSKKNGLYSLNGNFPNIPAKKERKKDFEERLKNKLPLRSRKTPHSSFDELCFDKLGEKIPIWASGFNKDLIQQQQQEN